MEHLNRLIGLPVDALLRRFDSPWPALVAAALATAVLLLLIFRITSSGPGIRRAKQRLTARVLELVLFRHDPLVSLGALGRILAANLLYLRLLIVPVLVSTVPCLVILSQLSCWFSSRPLEVGESALVEVRFKPGFPVLERPVALVGATGAEVQTEGVRVPILGEIDWRLRATHEGTGLIAIRVADETPVEMRLMVGRSLQAVSTRRTRSGGWNLLLYPREPPIAENSSVVEIDIRYPRRLWLLGSLEIDWLLAFVVITMGIGFVLQRPLRVEI
jgi:hypothetical protein